MTSLFLSGSGLLSSGTIIPPPYLGVLVKSISIDVPLDELGSTDPSVTISGSTGTMYTFHSSLGTNARFKTDEIIYVTLNGSGVTDEYSAVVQYSTFGDSQGYFIDKNKAGLPLPSRLKRSPHSA